MPETYPDDATLLALTEDAQTGVPYIETGASPYYLQFRRMLQRLLLATGRANDLRVYADGELSIGVRAGRATIGEATVAFAGVSGVTLPPGVTRQIYLDDTGGVHVDGALPEDRSTFLPLAEVTTGAAAITTLTDRRGEVMFQSPNPTAIGLTATAEEINRALDGISAHVTASALSNLTAGPTIDADALHRHGSFAYIFDGSANFSLVNLSSDDSANVALALSLPSRTSDNALLDRDPVTGFLRQRQGDAAYMLLGAATASRSFPGELSATLADQLVGPVPVAGVIEAIVLSAGVNIQSSDTADSVSAAVKVNGSAVADTDASLTAAAGSGFRCTDRGEGIAAVLKTDGGARVKRGDLITVTLTRGASGVVSSEAADVAVLVVIRAASPA